MLNLTTVKRTDKTRFDIAAIMMLSPDMTKVREMRNEDKQEMMDFLSIRPVHTVVMASFINDNGVESELNRGKFYGYRDAAGVLEGVALIGHSTLVEARSDDALKALAFRARNAETPIHLIMSSGDAAETFWKYLDGGMNTPRLTCTEALFEISFPFLVRNSDWKIENATMDHLLPVAEAQAEVAFIECGVDPMARDREGFLKRVARRIEQGRVFVALDGDKLVFKADIIAETDNVAYLEGVYVSPEYRGCGVGSDCLSTVAISLLDRVENICMLSNVEFQSAHRSFQKAGFKNTDHCTTLFV